ncbi:hypothetical protein JCM17823_20010 [Halorubrum gandharaense]
MLIAPAAGAAVPAADSEAESPAIESLVEDPAENDSVVENGGATQVEPAQVGEENLTLRVLTTPPDAEPHVNVDEHGANVGTALESEVDKANAALETAAVVREIESAETNEERQRRILAAVNTIEQDEVSLNGQQTAAITAHSAGELSDRELLVELMTVSATAREYNERLEVLDELADETDGFSAPGRLNELRVQLQVYEGPVRDRALASVRGEIDATKVHVESTQGTVTLATITGGEYVREAFRTDRWDRGGGSISSEDAINATAEAYPETASLREPDAFGAGAIQRITISHEYGELRTFVGGGTDQVFVENQRMDLETFPDHESTSTVEDGFNATVDRSYPGGPVRVTVLDDEDGDPVSGVTVTMSVAGGDSEAIGSTDDDGVVWTLSPTESYRINVLDEPRVAILDGLEPTETPRVADERPAE